MAKMAKRPRKNGQQVLTAGEVAEYLRIPRSTLYKLAQEGKIPAMKIGRHWRFDRGCIETWMNEEMERKP